MRRGDTETMTLTLPEAVTAEAMFITFRQGGRTVLEKSFENVSGTSVNVSLGQEDTLLFAANSPVTMQLRYRDSEGNVRSSNPVRFTVGEVLKDGVI